VKKRLLAVAAALAGVATVVAAPADANHSWGNYHWARTSNPFTLRVIDANTSGWDGHLNTAISDWSRSSVLDLAKEAGREERNCRAVTGKVKSCNGAYGNNGWLGLATIRASGSHITSGTAKMNDTYFNSGSYNSTARQQVMCQEIGHTFGLTHQDESGADLNTCMDYSNALDNPSPNAHDYAQLETIYGSHLDGSTTVAAGLAADDNAKPDRVARIDRLTTSEITEEFADGTRRITLVTWALETRGRASEHAFDPGP
jgi:hypothetical protein